MAPKSTLMRRSSAHGTHTLLEQRHLHRPQAQPSPRTCTDLTTSRNGNGDSIRRSHKEVPGGNPVCKPACGLRSSIMRGRRVRYSGTYIRSLLIPASRHRPLQETTILLQIPFQRGRGIAGTKSLMSVGTDVTPFPR